MNPIDLIHESDILDEQFMAEDWKTYMASLGLAGAVMGAPVKVSTNKVSNPNVSSAKTSASLKATNSIPTTAENIVAATLVDESGGESGGESAVGMEAVMNIILNRTKHRTMEEAAVKCLSPSQFSGWNVVNKKNPADVSKFINDKAKHPRFEDALKLVEKAKKNTLIDNTKGADHFLNVPYVLQRYKKLPDWYDPEKITVVIGKHTFLKLN
jgi:hypothetical protein